MRRAGEVVSKAADPRGRLGLRLRRRPEHRRGLHRAPARRRSIGRSAATSIRDPARRGLPDRRPTVTERRRAPRRPRRRGRRSARGSRLVATSVVAVALVAGRGRVLAHAAHVALRRSFDAPPQQDAAADRGAGRHPTASNRSGRHRRRPLLAGRRSRRAPWSPRAMLPRAIGAARRSRGRRTGPVARSTTTTSSRLVTAVERRGRRRHRRRRPRAPSRRRGDARDGRASCSRSRCRSSSCSSRSTSWFAVGRALAPVERMRRQVDAVTAITTRRAVSTSRGTTTRSDASRAR